MCVVAPCCCVRLLVGVCGWSGVVVGGGGVCVLLPVGACWLVVVGCALWVVRCVLPVSPQTEKSLATPLTGRERSDGGDDGRRANPKPPRLGLAPRKGSRGVSVPRHAPLTTGAASRGHRRARGPPGRRPSRAEELKHRPPESTAQQRPAAASSGCSRARCPCQCPKSRT